MYQQVSSPPIYLFIYLIESLLFIYYLFIEMGFEVYQ